MPSKVLVDTDSAQTLTNKTLTSVTIPSPILTTPTISNPVFSGTATGSLTALALTAPALTSPTISGPVISGSITGTYTIGGTPTLAINDNKFSVVDDADTSKALVFELSGQSTTRTLTVAPAQSTSQTLNIPNLTASDTVVTTGLAQTVTGVKTLTNPTTAAGTTAIPSMTLTAGTNLSSSLAGAIENDAIGMYHTTNTTDGRSHVPARQHRRLIADGGAITTIANFFGATSNIVLVPSAFYYIEIVLYFLKTTGSTIVITLTNSAAPTSQNIYWEQSPITGIVAPPGTATMLIGQVPADATAAKAITTGSLTTAVNHYIRMRLELTNAAGTSLLIQATSTAGSLTPLNGSYWTSTRIPTSNTGAFAA